MVRVSRDRPPVILEFGQKPTGDDRVDEMTAGQAADLIMRQRRQIADLKRKIEEKDAVFNSLSYHIAQLKKGWVEAELEVKRIRKKLAAEVRAERAKAHAIAPIRGRRVIEG